MSTLQPDPASRPNISVAGPSGTSSHRIPNELEPADWAGDPWPALIATPL
jgi:hypothetical protein